MSVFTHITDQWSQWLTELHRVMRPGGLAVITVLGRGMVRHILNQEWDDRVGIAIVDLHKDWDIGGPSVLLAEWWVREHWGRAFEILSFDRSSGAGGHDVVTMRRRETDVSPEMLARSDMADPREHDSVACNLEIILRQQIALGNQLREERTEAAVAAAQTAHAQELRQTVERLQGELERVTADAAQQGAVIEAYAAECARLRECVEVIMRSRSWRMTAPLRRAGARARGLR